MPIWWAVSVRAKRLSSTLSVISTVISFLAEENGLRITTVAETHIHADFVSGAEEFVADPDIHLYLSGEGGPDWNYQWPKPGPNTRLLKNGDSFMVGNIRVEAIHTPEHLSYL